MEWISGNIFIRANPLDEVAAPSQRHSHNFAHTTFGDCGWMLVRGVMPDGRQIINQFCSPEYRNVRAMQLKYEPEKVLRPVRFPDTAYHTEDGKLYARFNIVMIGQGDPVPEGGTEIMFEPVGSHRLILAEVEHEFVALSEGARFNCVYSHRTPQGEVTQVYDGWEGAYV